MLCRSQSRKHRLSRALLTSQHNGPLNITRRRAQVERRSFRPPNRRLLAPSQGWRPPRHATYRRFRPAFSLRVPVRQSLRSDPQHRWSTPTGAYPHRTRLVHSEWRCPERNTHGHHGRGDPFFWVGRCHCDGAPPSSPPWKAVSDREGVAHPGRSMT